MKSTSLHFGDLTKCGEATLETLVSGKRLAKIVAYASLSMWLHLACACAKKPQDKDIGIVSRTCEKNSLCNAKCRPALLAHGQ